MADRKGRATPIASWFKIDPVEFDMPRDRLGTFEPMTVGWMSTSVSGSPRQVPDDRIVLVRRHRVGPSGLVAEVACPHPSFDGERFRILGLTCAFTSFPYGRSDAPVHRDRIALFSGAVRSYR